MTTNRTPTLESLVARYVRELRVLDERTDTEGDQAYESAQESWHDIMTRLCEGGMGENEARAWIEREVAARTPADAASDPDGGR